MPAVKEPTKTVVVFTPEVRSSFNPRSAPGGPTEPPAPPPGGPERGRGNGKWLYYLLALIVSVLLWIPTANAYSITLGDTVAAQALGLFAWFILIVTAAKCTMREELSRPYPAPTVDDAIENAKVGLSNHLWDGLFLLTICFHLAVYNGIVGVVWISSVAAVLITLAYFVEILRSSYIPQSSEDLIDLLKL
jgi:hypothetical protein